MATLDRSKPFAQIVNDEEGRAFEQDGAYFTAGGEAWTPADAPAPASAGVLRGRKESSGGPGRRAASGGMDPPEW